MVLMRHAPSLSRLDQTKGLEQLLSNPRFRFCLRVTISALLAFALARFLAIPLNGLWAVLTAVVVSQMSVGGSLKAAAEYIIGTIGGAVYGGAVGALVPHSTAGAVAGVLALAIAPMAYAAALNPSFRVAPFTAVLVLMISNQFGAGPIESAFYRLVEVAIGGAIAMVVSLFVFPARAHALGLQAAANVLEQLAQALPQIFAGISSELDPLENLRIQNKIGQAVDAFKTIANDAKGERLVSLVIEPDPGRLARTLLRLRHDLVIIGRACTEPLPNTIAKRLGPTLARIGTAASDFLRASAVALTSRRSPPSVDAVELALAAYTAEITAIRGAGLTQAMPSDEIERICTLGFALHQFQHDFSDLARCAREWALRRA